MVGRIAWRRRPLCVVLQSSSRRWIVPKTVETLQLLRFPPEAFCCIDNMLMNSSGVVIWRGQQSIHYSPCINLTEVVLAARDRGRKTYTGMCFAVPAGQMKTHSSFYISGRHSLRLRPLPDR